MPALDLLDKNVKTEHIEGFLYNIQEMENYIRFNQGSTFEYSISQLENTSGQTDIDLVVSTLLEAIKYNSDITPAIQSNFKTNIKATLLSDWKKELSEILNKWFIDKHLSTQFFKTIAVEYMNRPENKIWEKEEKENFIKESEQSERRAAARLKKQKISVDTFIDLIETFMQSDFSIKRYDLQAVKRKDDLYPFDMYIYWGIEYELFLLQNDQKNILLHFGKLLS